MIRPKDVFSEAYRSLRHNRLRSALTMLGMAWGIATVVLLLAYGTGFSTAIVNIFRSYASMSAMGIAGGRTSMQAGGNKAGTSIRLTRDDIDRVVVNVPEVTRITPESFFDAPVSYEGRSYTWSIHGGNPALQEIQNLQLDLGRFYSAGDLQLRARVCVLGSESREKLFSGRFPLGEKIRISGIPYEVIGVLKPRPQEGTENSINRVVYIPFPTMSDFRNTYYIDMIWLDFLGYNYGGVEKSVRNTLAAQHNFRADDKRALFVFSMMEQLSQFRIITMALQVHACLHWDSDSWHWRRGTHEHHAGERNSANARDRGGEGVGCSPLRYPRAVPVRSARDYLFRRPFRYCARLHHFLLRGESHVLQCACPARRGGRHPTHHFTSQRVGFYR